MSEIAESVAKSEVVDVSTQTMEALMAKVTEALAKSAQTKPRRGRKPGSKNKNQKPKAEKTSTEKHGRPAFTEEQKQFRDNLKVSVVYGMSKEQASTEIAKLREQHKNSPAHLAVLNSADRSVKMRGLKRGPNKKTLAKAMAVKSVVAEMVQTFAKTENNAPAPEAAQPVAVEVQKAEQPLEVVVTKAPAPSVVEAPSATQTVDEIIAQLDQGL